MVGSFNAEENEKKVHSVKAVKSGSVLFGFSLTSHVKIRLYHMLPFSVSD